MKQLMPVILLLLMATQSGCGQTAKITAPVSFESDSNFLYSRFLPGNFLQMEVDGLDNVYLVTPAYQLKKFNAEGDSIGVYNDVKRFGNQSYIDVTNPFKTLVYYKNFATAVILDRQLTFRNAINFRNNNIFIVKAISTTYDNNIWLFDEQDFKLKKITDEGRLLFESNDMRLLSQPVPSPSRIIENDNIVYLYDIEKGFYLFDYYGALKNNLPLLNWHSVSITKNILYGFTKNELHTYDTQTMQLKNFPLPPVFANSKNIKAINGKVYLLLNEGVVVYQVK
ncbi:MAG: hypothetical protein ABIO05_04690 [Ferruginibacter sp.]